MSSQGGGGGGSIDIMDNLQPPRSDLQDTLHQEKYWKTNLDLSLIRDLLIFTLNFRLWNTEISIILIKS